MDEGSKADVFASATTAISDLVTKATSFINDNAVVIFGVLTVSAGISIGFKLFKKFTGKIG